VAKATRFILNKFSIKRVALATSRPQAYGRREFAQRPALAGKYKKVAQLGERSERDEVATRRALARSYPKGTCA
jgi:hypothetical protein